jgi:IclR family transcriptional regulator, acetate operon repressor
MAHKLDKALRPEPKTYAVRAVERTLDILDVLAKSRGAITLAAIAEEVGVPRSTAFRYVAVLEARRYITRVDDARYRLGPAFLAFGRPIMDSLAATARPFLEGLRERYGETMNLGILAGSRVLYVVVLESSRAVRLSARPGDLDFIHSSALGKAIAAHLSEDEVRAILATEGLPRLTANTIVSTDTYLRELEGVRARRHATDQSESEEGASCIAVAIETTSTPSRAAISLSCPSARFDAELLDQLVGDLSKAATDIAAFSDQKQA